MGKDRGSREDSGLHRSASDAALAGTAAAAAAAAAARKGKMDAAAGGGRPHRLQRMFAAPSPPPPPQPLQPLRAPSPSAGLFPHVGPRLGQSATLRPGALLKAADEQSSEALTLTPGLSSLRRAANAPSAGSSGGGSGRGSGGGATTATTTSTGGGSWWGRLTRFFGLRGSQSGGGQGGGGQGGRGAAEDPGARLSSSLGRDHVQSTPTVRVAGSTSATSLGVPQSTDRAREGRISVAPRGLNAPFKQRRGGCWTAPQAGPPACCAKPWSVGGRVLCGRGRHPSRGRVSYFLFLFFFAVRRTLGYPSPACPRACCRLSSRRLCRHRPLSFR